MAKAAQTTDPNRSSKFVPLWVRNVIGLSKCLSFTTSFTIRSMDSRLSAGVNPITISLALLSAESAIVSFNIASASTAASSASKQESWIRRVFTVPVSGALENMITTFFIDPCSASRDLGSTDSRFSCNPEASSNFLFVSGLIPSYYALFRFIIQIIAKACNDVPLVLL